MKRIVNMLAPDKIYASVIQNSMIQKFNDSKKHIFTTGI
jgi:hypothetical protein